MSEADRYAVTVRRLTEDGADCWRASVKELPDVVEYAATREEAIALAIDAIEGLMEAAREEGRPFPPPCEDEEQYSGRVTVRMPPTLHRRLAQMAETESTSLNQYLVLLLSWSASDAAALQPAWASSAQAEATRKHLSAFDFIPTNLYRALATHARTIGEAQSIIWDANFDREQSPLRHVRKWAETIVGRSEAQATTLTLADLQMNRPLLPTAEQRIKQGLKRGKTHGAR